MSPDPRMTRPPGRGAPARPRRMWLPLAAVVFLLAGVGGALILASLGWDVSSLRRSEPTPVRAVAPAAQSTQAQDLLPPPPAPTAVAASPVPPPTLTPTPAPTLTPTPIPPPLVPAGVVSGALVNVRAGPSTAYAILGQVREGERVEILGRNPEESWWQICCVAGGAGGGAETGWISADFVETDFPNDAAGQIPVAESPPPPPAPVAAAGGGDQAAALLAAPASGLPGQGGFPAPGGVNPLTGLPLAGENQNRRPVVVCINNDAAARPQVGLSQADVIYDYLMEGYSITRFSAIYYGESADRIGPVRSARLINYYLGALYDAGLVCSGASDGVRYVLKHEAPFPYLDIDLDDPNNNRYSTSLGSDYRTRLQTSTAGFRAWLANRGTERAPSVRGFTFGAPIEGGAPASQITVPFPGVTGSQVSYRYDVGSDRYLRFMGGGAHVEAATGAQLAFDNVVVQYVPHEVTDIVEDSLGSKSIRLNLFGSGRAIVFRNGLAFEGTWRSESRGDTPRFFANDGREIPLKPGKSWISVTPLNYTIAYQ